MQFAHLSHENHSPQGRRQPPRTRLPRAATRFWLWMRRNAQCDHEAVLS